jgi:hypothetical protein
MKIEYHEDCDELIPLLESWKAEQNGKSMGIDVTVEGFVNDINKWLSSLGGTILVASDMKNAVGFMVLVTVPSEFGDQKWGVEKGWYVLPKTPMAGLLLYRRAEDWCRENGCSHFLMSASHLASDMHDKVCRFYEKMGMTQFETTFIKEME